VNAALIVSVVRENQVRQNGRAHSTAACKIFIDDLPVAEFRKGAFKDDVVRRKSLAKVRSVF
jgi:hypothetical protein